MSKKQTYVFIYGNSRDEVAGLGGVIKKAVGAQESCALRDITGDSADIKPGWQEFWQSLGEKAVRFFRDELPSEIQEYVDKAGVVPPVVLEWSGFGYRILVSKDELADCAGDEQKLIGLIRKRKGDEL